MAQKCKKCNRVVNVITKGICYRCNQTQPEPKIIAVDFDGTLVYNNWPDIGPSKDLVIDYIRHLKEKGWKVILWTCRTGEHLQAAIEFCLQKLNLTFDAVNENLPQSIKKYNADPRKITADIYLDDRSKNLDHIYEKEVR